MVCCSSSKDWAGTFASQHLAGTGATALQCILVIFTLAMIAGAAGSSISTTGGARALEALILRQPRVLFTVCSRSIYLFSRTRHEKCPETTGVGPALASKSRRTKVQARVPERGALNGKSCSKLHSVPYSPLAVLEFDGLLENMK